MMVDPPGAGDDFGVPGLGVAYGHRPGFAEGLGRDRSVVTPRRRRGGGVAGVVLHDDGGSAVEIRVNVDVPWLANGKEKDEEDEVEEEGFKDKEEEEKEEDEEGE